MSYTITEAVRYRAGNEYRFKYFDTEEQAQRQCDEWARIDRANERLRQGATLAEVCAILKRPCPSGLEEVTIGHGFQMRWQATDLFAYRIEHIEPDGEFYVGGYGGWSGPYGRVIDLHRLADYPYRLGVERDPRTMK